jgi:hypothetical protein
MSSTDKTRQQLVDSIRKTKAAAAGKTPAVIKKSPQRVSRKVTSTKNAAATIAGKQPANATGGSWSGNSDPYQVGRRVWPD